MENSRRYFKKSKKTTVQLTSLLDLLFVMIFVSLIQQKNIPKKVEEQKKERVVKTVIIKQEAKPEKPAPTKYNVEATFEFYATASTPGLPPGSFLMQGTFDEETGKLNLFGAQWIKRPTNFDMVPLSGVVNKSRDSISGKVDAIYCKTFTLRRAQINSGNAISGVWKGKYDCGQGSTGLTLTIK